MSLANGATHRINRIPNLPSASTVNLPYTSSSSQSSDYCTTANTSSTSSTLRSRAPFLKRAIDRIHLAYYRYEVTFGIYPMTTGEKLVAHSFVLMFTALFLWGVCLYFPSIVFQKLGRLAWLLTGKSEARWARQPRAVVNATEAAVNAAAAAAAVFGGQGGGNVDM